MNRNDIVLTVQQRWRLGVHDGSKAFIECRFCNTAIIVLLTKGDQKSAKTVMHGSCASWTRVEWDDDGTVTEHGSGVILGRCTNKKCSKHIEVVLNDLLQISAIASWAEALRVERERLELPVQDNETREQPEKVAKNPKWRGSRATLLFAKDTISVSGQLNRRYEEPESEHWRQRQALLEERLLKHLRANDFDAPHRRLQFRALFYDAEQDWLDLYIAIWEEMIHKYHGTSVREAKSSLGHRVIYDPEYPAGVVQNGYVIEKVRTFPT